ncbi:hypothetical protein SUGI_0181780 [Cryptomeria japonica]|nr:hypothetical protein SUGI_0181780 [Cryptomeria japonica]
MSLKFCQSLKFSQSLKLSGQTVVDQQFCSETATELTIWNKSLLFSGEGFTVLDSNGDLLFRVDTYALAANHLILMDSQGKVLLTLRRKLPSLHHRWEGFLGDKLHGQEPVFTVMKSSILPTKECVQVFMNCGFFWKPCSDYEVEGSFSQRYCTIFTNGPRMAAAEVKRKTGCPGTMIDLHGHHELRLVK